MLPNKFKYYNIRPHNFKFNFENWKIQKKKIFQGISKVKVIFPCTVGIHN